jgi:hypothetical protein
MVCGVVVVLESKSPPYPDRWGWRCWKRFTARKVFCEEVCGLPLRDELAKAPKGSYVLADSNTVGGYVRRILPTTVCGAKGPTTTTTVGTR